MIPFAASGLKPAIGPYPIQDYPGNLQPSFLGVSTTIYLGLKTFILYGLAKGIVIYSSYYVHDVHHVKQHGVHPC